MGRDIEIAKEIFHTIELIKFNTDKVLRYIAENRCKEPEDYTEWLEQIYPPYILNRLERLKKEYYFEKNNL